MLKLEKELDMITDIISEIIEAILNFENTFMESEKHKNANVPLVLEVYTSRILGNKTQEEIGQKFYSSYFEQCSPPENREFEYFYSNLFTFKSCYFRDFRDFANLYLTYFYNSNIIMVKN